MQLIYIHGLNSDANSEKGKMLKDWCLKNRPDIRVRQPDLNLPPQEVIKTLVKMISADPDTGLVASSLGGFYATVCADMIPSCKAVLLNPSMYPYQSMQRFFTPDATPETIGHVTPGGWQIIRQQLNDLAEMRPQDKYCPEHLLILLKKGDETLDYRQAADYFNRTARQSIVMIEEGGDHYYSDLPSKIPLIIQFLFENKAK